MDKALPVLNEKDTLYKLQRIPLISQAVKQQVAIFPSQLATQPLH